MNGMIEAIIQSNDIGIAAFAVLVTFSCIRLLQMAAGLISKLLDFLSQSKKAEVDEIKAETAQINVQNIPIEQLTKTLDRMMDMFGIQVQAYTSVADRVDGLSKAVNKDAEATSAATATLRQHDIDVKLSMSELAGKGAEMSGKLNVLEQILKSIDALTASVNQQTADIAEIKETVIPRLDSIEAENSKNAVGLAQVKTLALEAQKVATSEQPATPQAPGARSASGSMIGKIEKDKETKS